MDIISEVTLLGGACDHATLRQTRSRSEIDRALREGTLIRTARGRYALADAREFVRRASAVGGIVSHRSAALFHGWALREVPEKPDVTFPRERHLSRRERELVVPHWSELHEVDHAGIVTTPRRTLIDCMRNLPLVDSVPIVDSAIRADDFTGRHVRAIARSTRGRGRARILAVAEEATSQAANQFESLLRAVAGQVAGLDLKVQHPIRTAGGRVLHPDLADPALKIAVEAESFQWHGESAQLTRDCWRYNAFVLAGWLVVRFSWYQVHFQPTYVRETLIGAVRLARGHANVA